MYTGIEVKVESDISNILGEYESFKKYLESYKLKSLFPSMNAIHPERNVSDEVKLVHYIRDGLSCIKDQIVNYKKLKK
ncbi:hypothetical protein LX59_00938 [Azomonas agilis]|uniref:Uncharacterized protein n=1 Tax=Azomonas agilis TaxID=116849 RepID=A0A562J192_9GAMM|nr:hypothetical protein [Azomonas agilis]TWH76893.1 hypothetical protein LX59_00938 [Azomonas agilis]